MATGTDKSAGEASLGRDQFDDQALDTLAALLRVLGKVTLDVQGLDTQRFANLTEEWAKHLLSLAPAPGAGAGRVARRDWRGVRQFVHEHRMTEQQLVLKSSSAWRDVVSTLITSINQSFEGEHQSDGQVLETMKSFCASIGQTDIDELKKNAEVVAGTLSAAFHRRKATHERQMYELGRKVDTLGHQLSEAERQKSIDPLTSLHNRRVLDAALAEAASLRHGYGHRATLSMLDVDHFKKVNDQYGHSSGDAVLKGLADTLTRCFPRRTDVVVRFGGEEFAVLLSHTGEADAAIAVARLQEAVRALVVRHNERAIQISISVGVAEIQPDQTIAQWIDSADACLYQAKKTGRDRAVLASQAGVPPKK